MVGLEYSADYWKRLKSFVENKRVKASPSQMDALKIAVKIPDRVPSGYQAKCIIEIQSEAIANGFK